MPAGTILFDTRTVPYPLSGVGNLVQVKTRREYQAVDWPVTTRRYEAGVYADEVLQHFFPTALGIITNIGNGYGMPGYNGAKVEPVWQEVVDLTMIERFGFTKGDFA